MKKNNLFPQIISILCISITIITTSCTKEDNFLNTKPDQALTVPSTLDDYQALLNYEDLFNGYYDPAFGEMSSDEIYVPSDVWERSEAYDRNVYIFANDAYAGSSLTLGSDWMGQYQRIYYANTVLDGLSKIKTNTKNQSKYNQIKGTALFFRAWAYYCLVQTFTLPYDKKTANTDLGIVLRLTPDINAKIKRSSVQQSYDQIFKDLKDALQLLPEKSNIVTQPDKVATLAFLARINLAINNYQDAFKYSDECLSKYNVLSDYNTLTPTLATINTSYLPEDLFHASMANYNIILFSSARMDTALYALYDKNDLRKTIFFSPSADKTYLRFRGTYDTYWHNKYTGLATDEMYLIRAECYARDGQTQKSMNDLNTLLAKRYKEGTFIPKTANTPDDALNLVLLERRKELFFRGLRWTDLRRLNSDPRFATTVTHIVNGQKYILEPGSLKYASTIPQLELKLNDVQQNPR